MFLLPHEVSVEPYLKTFQYKFLNSIPFTTRKLCKIGYISGDKCSFCKLETETLHHVFFDCDHLQCFWKDFEYFFYIMKKEFVHLTIQGIIVGILYAKCTPT